MYTAFRKAVDVPILANITEFVGKRRFSRARNLVAQESISSSIAGEASGLSRDERRGAESL